MSGGKALTETVMTHAYHVINLILIPRSVVISVDVCLLCLVCLSKQD